MDREPVYVDAHLRGVFWREKRLLVDSERLSWGARSVPFDSVTAVAYWFTENRLARGCEIVLHTGKERVHVAFRARDKEKFGLYERTLAALRAHVERRLLSELLVSVATGEEVSVASFQVSRIGLRVRRSQVSWDAIVAVEPPAWQSPKAPRGDVIIYARDGRGDVKPFADVFFSQPNGPLVPSLVRACVSRYADGS